MVDRRTVQVQDSPCGRQTALTWEGFGWGEAALSPPVCVYCSKIKKYKHMNTVYHVVTQHATALHTVIYMYIPSPNASRHHGPLTSETITIRRASELAFS